MEILFDLAVLASEEWVPPNDWRAQIAVPMGILFLLGGTFMLLRANLGTRRAYLLEATSFFGVMLLISLFWAFGAPGTPPYTGPQNLPGQQIDHYQPKWVPFAADSVVAQDPEFQSVVQGHPETFEEVDPEAVEAGAGDIQAFFASDVAGQQVGDDWVVTQAWEAPSEEGRRIVAAEFTEADSDAPTEPDPEGESYIGFGFFDEGFLILPSLIFIVGSAIGFLVHVVLLGWDERRERRDLEEDLAAEEEEERVPTPA